MSALPGRRGRNEHLSLSDRASSTKTNWATGAKIALPLPCRSPRSPISEKEYSQTLELRAMAKVLLHTCTRFQ